MEGKFYVSQWKNIKFPLPNYGVYSQYVHSLFAYSLIPKLLGNEASLNIIRQELVLAEKNDNFSAKDKSHFTGRQNNTNCH